MPSKLQFYSEFAERTVRQITGSYRSWTAFLATAARLYKYPYNEQLMIYAQRPNATACAEYDFWKDRMGRYVQRGSTGIALIDTSGYRRRIVIGADNLVEKIRIFDAGLDDRLIEIYKIMLYGQMQPQLAEMPGGDDVDAVFVDEQLDGSLDLVFVANGQAVGAVPFSKEVYDIIEKQYSDAVSQLADAEPVIDQDWAFDFLAKVAQQNA